MAGYSDEELLKIVGEERKRSIGFGFENDATLAAERNQALRFIKGDMSKEIPSLPNRSSAVSTDISDAIQTLLPDLIEIFIGDGDDALAFVPVGQEDEEAAEQETDYLSHVVFQQNDGFLLFYSMFSDALSQKTGIAKYWWETEPAKEEARRGLTVDVLQQLEQAGELIAYEEAPPVEGSDPTVPTYSATVMGKPSGKVCIKSVPPEDFTVAVDTVRLADATYCAHRTRERAQDLIARGIDPDKVAELPRYSRTNTETDQARDTAGEYEQQQLGDASDDNLRQVEIVEHYIRLLDGEDLKLFRVQTNVEQTVLIDQVEVERIPFAAITPYIVTHRFYGQSVADFLGEIQKINSVLTRMVLDSGYFALNQRVEVASSGASSDTLPDLLRNEPGVPIRSTTGQTVRAIEAGKINFDLFGALEYFQTKGEQRTGIVRNAQGLNPDTLHDTASGAAALMAAAQKRVRMIARVFAETGIKDLYLGVHAEIVDHAEEHRKGAVQLRNGWTEIDPRTWVRRSDMKIEVGIGSGGKAGDLIALTQQGEMLEKIIAMQGGPTGPLVTPENVYNFAKRFMAKTGCKTPESFISDPANAQPQPPKPDPLQLEMQAKTQLQAMDIKGKLQVEQMRVEADQRKAETDLTLERERMAWDHQFKTEEAQRKFQFDQAQAAAELELKREEMALEAQIKVETAHIGAAATASASVDGPNMGGEPG